MMTQKISKFLGQILTIAIAACTCGSSSVAASKRFADWATISHPRHGFQIAYPGNIFAPSGGQSSDDGQVFVSHDGAAKLIVAAFANDSGATMADYRAQLLNENYEMPLLPMGSTEGILRGIYKLSSQGDLDPKKPVVQLFGSGSILRESGPPPNRRASNVR